MSEADRTTFLTELTDADNATASFVLNGAQQQNAQRSPCATIMCQYGVLFKFGRELIPRSYCCM